MAQELTGSLRQISDRLLDANAQPVWNPNAPGSATAGNV